MNFIFYLFQYLILVFYVSGIIFQFNGFIFMILVNLEQIFIEFQLVFINFFFGQDFFIQSGFVFLIVDFVGSDWLLDRYDYFDMSDVDWFFIK